MKTLRIVAIVCALISPLHGAAFAGDRVEHIRPRDSHASFLLQFGIQSSRTFRQLVRDLNRSNVIVYIDVRQDPVHLPGGSLTFVGGGGGWRWVRVTIDTGTTDHGNVLKNAFYFTETLGHELQHAREVAAATSMTTGADFEALFRGIGRSVGERSFDTAEAVHTGRMVAAELRTGLRLDAPDTVCASW